MLHHHIPLYMADEYIQNHWFICEKISIVMDIIPHTKKIKLQSVLEHLRKQC